MALYSCALVRDVLFPTYSVPGIALRHSARSAKTGPSPKTSPLLANPWSNHKMRNKGMRLRVSGEGERTVEGVIAVRSTIDLRPIEADGLAPCAAMMMETPPWSILDFTTESCLAALSMPRVGVVGAYRDNVLVGFVATLAEGIEFEPLIVFLCVAEDHRDQGIGTSLLNYFEEYFSKAANLYLFVSDVNPGAQRLYQRLGYLPVGALPNFNLAGQTEFLYRKTRRVLNS